MIHDTQGPERANASGHFDRESSSGVQTRMAPTFQLMNSGEASTSGAASGGNSSQSNSNKTSREDDFFEAFYGQHQLGTGKDAYTDVDETDKAKIMGGVVPLTEVFDSSTIVCNCFGWAHGINADLGEELSRVVDWKEHYDVVAPGQADVVVWGRKKGDNEDYWEALHASVKLSVAELAERLEEFTGETLDPKKLTKAGISGDCWSSAGGMGYGVMVHPRDWYEGGEYGTALAYLKRK